jgi:hypothetical protein
MRTDHLDVGFERGGHNQSSCSTLACCVPITQNGWVEVTCDRASSETFSNVADMLTFDAAECASGNRFDRVTVPMP